MAEPPFVATGFPSNPLIDSTGEPTSRVPLTVLIALNRIEGPLTPPKTRSRTAEACQGTRLRCR